MMKIKVTLEFEYDPTEDISDWGLDSPVTHVDTPDKAIDVARAELSEHSPFDFIFTAWVENDEGHVEGFMKG